MAANATASAVNSTLAALNVTVNSTANGTTVCKYMKATSDGAWVGDLPINFALPLLIIQLSLVLFFSRIFAVLLRPLRQPRVIAEVLGGIVLGTSVMGRIPGFTAAIFPPRSLPVLTTVANLGLHYFLFMVGLELNLETLSKVGGKAMWISAAGIIFPFGMGVGASFAARAVVGITSPFAPFLVFMGVAMSITAFPVLARILAERKLLTTDVGQLAMSVAAVDDVVAWVLLALAVALSTPNASAAVVAWIILCALAFVLFMFFAMKPIMEYLTRGVMSPHEPLPEWLVAFTLVGVLITGFVTDTIGIHGIFGSFVFGLIIPKGGPFPTMILEKIEDFTTIVLLPLYFASSGLAVNFQSIKPSSVGLVFLIMGVACAGKIFGVLGAALVAKFPFRTSLVLGILMNTKGLVELIVLNIGLTKGVINVELYTIMVIMALATTFMTTPLVMAVYAPARDKKDHTKSLVHHTLGGTDNELRLLECVYGPRNVPSILSLTEAFRGTRKHPLRVFLMNLVEYSERSSAIVMVTKVRKGGRPYWNKEAEKRGQDQVVVAFKAYADLSRVNVVPLTAISRYDNMHEDICHTAEDRRTSLIVMPYYKQLNTEGEEVVNHSYQQVTRKLLRTAPCSVAILVDRGLEPFSQAGAGVRVEKHVAVLFFGGPDDREALILARRMAEHPGVSLTVLHLVPTNEAAISLEIEQQQQQQSAAEGLAHSVSAASFAVSLDRGVQEQERKEDESALDHIRAMLSGDAAGEEGLPVSETAEKEEEEREGEGEGSGESEEGEVQPLKRRVRKERRKVAYEKRAVDDIVGAINGLEQEQFDLIVVGRGRRPALLVAGMAAQSTPFRSYYRPGFMSNNAIPTAAEGSAGSDLGPVGDLLAASEISSSILVVQQHDETMVRAMSAV